MSGYSHTTVRGVRLEMLEEGSGSPLLFLNSGYGLDFEGASLGPLARYE